MNASRLRRTARITAWGLTASVLASVGIGAAVPAVAKTSCRVTNNRTGATSRHLQTSIAAASSEDTLILQGVCVGNFVVDKPLKFVGKATKATPEATLDGGNSGTVVTVNDAVQATFKDVVITHGNAASVAGGVNVAGGTLILSGHTKVVDNTAPIGGGIVNYGTVTLNGYAHVNGNHATSYGGGINNNGTVTLNKYAEVNGNDAVGYSGGFDSTGTVILNSYAQVDSNTSGNDGGGLLLYSAGAVTLNDYAEVRHNISGGSGGGIATLDTGSILLKDYAVVTGNTASDTGGGISDPNTLLSACNNVGLNHWIGTISPNNPDDAPTVTLIAC